MTQPDDRSADRAPSGVAFADDAHAVASRLRSAMAALIGAAPGGIRSGSELARRFQIGTTLAWQLYTFSEARSPLDVVGQLPGRPSMERLLAAAKKLKLPAEVIQRLDRAHRDLEALIERHAGDRLTFASMVSALGSGSSAQLDYEAKRDAFRAMSHICGYQRDVAVACGVAFVEESGRIAVARIEGSIGLRLMKPVEQVCISRRGFVSFEADHTPVQAQPIDPARPEFKGAPVMADFCSKPLPKFSSSRTSPEWVEHYVGGIAVGRQDEATCYLGQVHHNVASPSEPARLSEVTMCPTALLMHDVLLPASVADRRDPETRVYANALGPSRELGRDIDLLNVQEQAVYMGMGIEALQTPAAPRYMEVLEHVCRRLGQDPNSFAAFRCRVDFPVLYSLIAINFPGGVSEKTQPRG